MKIAFTCLHELPRLSWCATLATGADSVRVLHGPGVECSDESFTEGAWCGRFDQDNFDFVPFFGSGGKITKNGFLVCPPSHTLEKVYASRIGNKLHVSNSLPFLLHVLGATLDPDFLYYYAWFWTIKYGLKCHKNWIPTREGNKIRIYYYNNIFFSKDLQVIQTSRPAPPDFRDFSEYTAFVRECLMALTANASDIRRKTQYTPLTTISSGYDSVAAAVWSRSIGCCEAITFSTARGVRHPSDSGARIAERLGLKVHELDRLGHLQFKDFPEIETNGWASEFASMRELLPNRLFLTGFHGDTMWDRNCRYVGRDIVRGDASGSDLAELRYKWGFIHVPVPFLGATSLPSIYRISRSEEMREWTLNTKYDRPIPRRWTEEAGIPREWFGQKKRAAAININEEGFKRVMSASSFADFRNFTSKHWTWRRRAVGEFARIYGMFRNYNLVVQQKFSHLSFWGWRLSVPLILPHLPAQGKQTLLIHWAMHRLGERYRFNRKVVGD